MISEHVVDQMRVLDRGRGQGVVGVRGLVSEASGVQEGGCVSSCLSQHNAEIKYTIEFTPTFLGRSEYFED